MKTTALSPALAIVLALWVTLAPAAEPSPDAAAARSGTVKRVEGTVMLVSPQGGQRQLQAGDAVAAADRLVVGPNSAASLVLRDGTTLMLGPDSQLEIKAFSFDATRQEGHLLLSMLRGTMRMITGLIGKAKPEAVRIETPTSVIGVLGTDFIVHAEGKP